MIGALLKNWKLILDILLVIAMVVLLFVWNPFGIFGGGLSLAPTTNMVTKVREIGQLVTSEYYGEAIASIEEARMNRIEEEEVSDRASNLYDHLYGAAKDLLTYQNQPIQVREAAYKSSEPIDGWKRIIRQSVNRRNILDKLSYHQLLDDLTVDPLYEEVLEYIWLQDNNNKQYNATAKQKEEALFLLYSFVEKNRETTLDKAGFTSFYYKNKESQVSRKETKKKLAMVGRGWVKAGFDFSRMDDNMFYLDDEAGELHFFGLSAVILDADINPWFIPEKGIPGFEILDYNGKVDFRDAKKVKQYCIDKLVLNAHRAEILKNAERHGAETLKSLFSLMTGKKIEKVFFHNDRIIQLSKEIAKDKLINFEEATLLDSQITRELEIIDSLRGTRENSHNNQQQANHREKNISVAIAELRHYPFQDFPGTFSYFSKIIHEVAEDSILDATELNQLEAMRIHWQPNVVDTDSVQNRQLPYWFEDSLNFTSAYNYAIEYLLEQGVVAGSVEDSTLLMSEITPTFLEENWVQDYHYTNSKSIVATLVKKSKEPRKILLNQLYPFQYNEVAWDSLMSKKNLWLDSLPAGQEIIPDIKDKNVWVYDASTSPVVKRLNIPLKTLINQFLLENVREDELIWVSEDLCFIPNGSSAEALKNPLPSPFLTERQRIELEAYYRHLVENYRNRKNIGPVVRANEWVQKKFENNKPVSEWLAELKYKIFN